MEIFIVRGKTHHTLSVQTSLKFYNDYIHILYAKYWCKITNFGILRFYLVAMASAKDIAVYAKNLILCSCYFSSDLALLKLVQILHSSKCCQLGVQQHNADVRPWLRVKIKLFSTISDPSRRHRSTVLFFYFRRICIMK